eukprot:3893923-Amphidinium_carterae.1
MERIQPPHCGGRKTWSCDAMALRIGTSFAGLVLKRLSIGRVPSILVGMPRPTSRQRLRSSTRDPDSNHKRSSTQRSLELVAL